MIGPGKGVVVGVSGGPDSVALMHLLNALKSEMDFWVVAAHMDHRLREDSGKDAAFVRDIGEKMGVRVEVRTEDVRQIAATEGISLEEAGRRGRYRFFEEIRTSTGAEVIATAHHMDDELETFFLRIFRGSSLQGLTGIAPVRGRIIRPLIQTERADIIRFLETESIPYRVDPTNLQSDTDRNFVRNRIFPVISERFPHFKNPLKRTLVTLEEEERFLDAQARKLYSEAVSPGEDGLVLDVERLKQAPRVLVARVVLRALYNFSGPEVRWNRSHVHALIKTLYSSNPSARLDLAGRVTTEREYGRVRISGPRNEKTQGISEITVHGPGKVEVPPAGMTLNFRLLEDQGGLPENLDGEARAFFDADEAAFPLTLRGFRPGDRFRPWGLRGSRKLKKVFIDMKVPACLRRTIPLLVKGEEILWVPGIRRGQGAPVLPGTRRVLEVSLVNERKS